MPGAVSIVLAATGYLPCAYNVGVRMAGLILLAILSTHLQASPGPKSVLVNRLQTLLPIYVGIGSILWTDVCLPSLVVEDFREGEPILTHVGHSSSSEEEHG